MFLFHPPIFFSMAETNKQKEEGKKQRPPRTLVSLLYVNERCVNLFLLPHPPPKCWAKLLRCFIVPHASGFPYSLCGTVSRASTVFSCRHHTATHRGTLILTLPSLLHKRQLCDYVHKQAAHTLTHTLLVPCHCVVQTLRTFGDIKSYNNNPGAHQSSM